MAKWFLDFEIKESLMKISQKSGVATLTLQPRWMVSSSSSNIFLIITITNRYTQARGLGQCQCQGPSKWAWLMQGGVTPLYINLLYIKHHLVLQPNNIDTGLDLRSHYKCLFINTKLYV